MTTGCKGRSGLIGSMGCYIDASLCKVAVLCRPCFQGNGAGPTHVDLLLCMMVFQVLFSCVYGCFCSCVLYLLLLVWQRLCVPYAARELKVLLGACDCVAHGWSSLGCDSSCGCSFGVVGSAGLFAADILLLLYRRTLLLGHLFRELVLVLLVEKGSC